MEIADYPLKDLLGIAGATVAIIIAGAIISGSFGAKYVHLFERYRGLTGELRENNASDERKQSLRAQIDNYRSRIRCTQVATVCMGVALLLFVFTVAVASFSVMMPKVLVLRTLGTIGLFAGLALIALAQILDLVETTLSRLVIRREVEDFADVSKD